MFILPQSNSKNYPNKIIQLFDLIDKGLLNNADDVTIASSGSIPSMIIGKNVTINAGVSLTFASPVRRSFIILANTLIVNGSISVSGVANINYLFDLWGVESAAVDTTNQGAMPAFFGGGRLSSTYGPYCFGGGNTVAYPNNGKNYMRKEMVLLPSADHVGAGQGLTTGEYLSYGGGMLLILAKSVSIGAAGTIISNGASGPNGIGNYPSGGGVVGILSNSQSFAPGSEISCNGTSCYQFGLNNNDGGGGGVIILLARESSSGSIITSVSGGVTSQGGSNGEDGTVLNEVWDFMSDLT